MPYEGKERRVGKDWLERDRLLTKIANDTEHIKTEIGKQTASFDIHVINDSTQFKAIKKRIFYLTCAVIVIGVVLGGPSFAMMFLK